MARNEMQGIEQREGRGGVLHYRGRAAGVKGPWTIDLGAAQAWRRQRLRDAEDGLLSERRLSLGEAIDEFTAGIADGSIRNKKDERYRDSVVRLYTRHLTGTARSRAAKGWSWRTEFGDRSPLDHVRLPHVKRATVRMRGHGDSDTTVRNRVVALRSLYAYALQVGYATINPCVGLPLPSRDKRVKRVVEAEEASLLTACLTGRDRVAFALAWLAGLRAGELLALRWSDIDFDARWIYITTAIDTTTRAWGDPKTYAGTRKVPIRGQLLAILEDYAVKHDDRESLLFPADRVPAGMDKVNTPMAYTSLVQRLRARWADAGLEPLQLHEGRHTFVSVLISAEGPNGERLDAKKIQTYAGHSSINVTYDVYGHLFPSDDEGTIRMLDEYDAR